ncbi:MAG: response regulator transcription factor [Anaerolineales bacterium]|jgi:DNA-binding NarL/FixJ family response regulator
MKTIRLLIADDHPVFRYGLKALLETEPGFEIVAEASNGEEAVKLAKEVQPDVILMDITMPGLNGIEASRQIIDENPDIGILMVTMVDDASMFAALRAGARGYLLKGSEGDETIRAIQAVAEGGAIFSPTIADRMISYFAHSSLPGQEAFPELTAREFEILSLMAKGLTNNAIAERLFLSPKTVRNQVSTIFNKLDVSDRGEAIVLAREAGLS